MPILPILSSSHHHHHPLSPPPSPDHGDSDPVVVVVVDNSLNDLTLPQTLTQFMLPNTSSSLSDSSSPPNSPSAFAFSPITADNNNDPFSPSSYDTDLTSFIGSWDPSPSFASSSSPRNQDKAKGKQKALTESVPSEITSNHDSKGKSVDRSYSLSSPSHFEFDFEFEQEDVDLSLANDNVQVSPPEFSEDIDDPHSYIANNPVSLSPSYTSTPSSSSYFNSYDIKPVPRHSFSSLSLKSLRSSSSRSFDRIRRSFGRKDSKFSDPKSSLKSNSSSPSPHSPSSSSRSSSTSSLQNKIRKVFKRKDSKRRNITFEIAISNDTEDEDDAPTSLDQSILSEITVSPRAQTDEAPEMEDVFAFGSTKGYFVDDEIPFGEMSKGIESLRLVSAPKDLYFELLPRELQLRILKDLALSYEDDYHRMSALTDPTLLWTAKIAESTRWVGRERGMRELVRLATVSKLWHSLVFDGQLWEYLHFSPYISLINTEQTVSLDSNKLPPTFLLTLAEQAGSFVRRLDLTGWSHLDNVTFRAISAALLQTQEVSNADGEQLSYVPSSSSLDSSFSSSLSVTKNLQGETHLTQLTLRGCTRLTMQGIHYILLRSPLLRVVDLHGMKRGVVSDLTCEILNAFCPVLERLDIGRCLGIRGTGLEKLVRGSDVEGSYPRTRSPLKILFASGIRGIDPDVLFTLARFSPFLEVLDLSYSDVTDECLGAFTWWDDDDDDDVGNQEEENGVYCKTEVSARYMPASLSRSAGFTFTPTRVGSYYKRVTILRHLNLSHTHITDDACAFLSHSVPKLEYLELAGIGTALEEEGLVKLLETTPFIRRIDLEDASRVGDAVLKALTPSIGDGGSGGPVSGSSSTSPQPGHILEHLILSYAHNITNTALLQLIRSCTRLGTLELDNTRVSCAVVRTFVETARERGIENAKIAIMDCRTCPESFVTELFDAGVIRPRLGFRAFEARAIGGFLDGRDRQNCGSPSSETPSSSSSSSSPVRGNDIDECDGTRVALKSFWSWQALDAAKEEERKRNGSNQENGRSRSSSGIGFGLGGSGPGSMGRPRWLSNWTRYLAMER